MLLSVERLRQYVTTDDSDQVLEEKLSALEHLIRKYTNNAFQARNKRLLCDITDGKLNFSAPWLAEDATIQISKSLWNNGVYTVLEIVDGQITLDNPDLIDEENVLITKVEYPLDVQIGAVNLLKWDNDNRAKVGLASETISRHSVTYFNMDGDNSLVGYPKALIGFLEPYKKARF